MPEFQDPSGESPSPVSKAAVFAALREQLAAKLEQARLELAALDEAALGETKSSAGDKYETAREMIGQSRSMQHRIREDAQALLDWLERQDASTTSRAFAAGAVVHASTGWLLVCPSPIELQVEGTRLQGVTLASPFGQACKGAHEGERRTFRDRSVEILEIL